MIPQTIALPLTPRGHTPHIYVSVYACVSLLMRVRDRDRVRERQRQSERERQSVRDMERKRESGCVYVYVYFKLYKLVIIALNFHYYAAWPLRFKEKQIWKKSVNNPTVRYTNTNTYRRCIMVIVVRNRHCDTSSNPRRSWLHFMQNYYSWERYKSNYSPASDG